MFNISQLATIPQLDLPATLERLFEIFREATLNSSQSVPVVSLYLNSGVCLQGYVVGLSLSPETRTVVIASTNNDGASNSQDLSYILVKDIGAATVHDSGLVIDHLTNGLLVQNTPEELSMQMISSELHRVLKEVNDSFETQFTAEIEETEFTSPEYMEALHRTIKDWGFVMRRFSFDQLSKQTFAERGWHFCFKPGPRANTEIDGSKMSLIIGSEERIEPVARMSIQYTLEEQL